MYHIHWKSPKSRAMGSMVKNIALMICISIIVTSFLSAAFILLHANHHHDHEGPHGTCTTCIRLSTTEHLLKQLSTAIVTRVYPLVFCTYLFLRLRPTGSYVGLFTLVSLKVRLDC